MHAQTLSASFSQTSKRGGREDAICLTYPCESRTVYRERLTADCKVSFAWWRDDSSEVSFRHTYLLQIYEDRDDIHDGRWPINECCHAALVTHRHAQPRHKDNRPTSAPRAKRFCHGNNTPTPPPLSTQFTSAMRKISSFVSVAPSTQTFSSSSKISQHEDQGL